MGLLGHTAGFAPSFLPARLLVTSEDTTYVGGQKDESHSDPTQLSGGASRSSSAISVFTHVSERSKVAPIRIYDFLSVACRPPTQLLAIYLLYDGFQDRGANL